MQICCQLLSIMLCKLIIFWNLFNHLFNLLNCIDFSLLLMTDILHIFPVVGLFTRHLQHLSPDVKPNMRVCSNINPSKYQRWEMEEADDTAAELLAQTQKI